MVGQSKGEWLYIILGYVVVITVGQLGREPDLVFQIWRRCLVPSEIRPPAITSAFARSSIPGLVFIEAFDIADVRRAVDGLVTVLERQPRLISSAEHVAILSRGSSLSSHIEVGQWVSCVAGRHRDDIGYVYKSSLPMNQWYATVAFVPRISQPSGKRKRGDRPAPRAWTAEELTRQFGKRAVKVLGAARFGFRGSLYQDGLVFEPMPWSLLRVSERSPQDIMPFVRAAKIRTLPAFAASLRRFAQDSVHIG